MSHRMAWNAKTLAAQEETAEHPDLRGLVAAFLNEHADKLNAPQHWSTEDVAVLQQHTIEHRLSLSPGVVGTTGLSSLLAQLDANPGGADHSPVIVHLQAFWDESGPEAQWRLRDLQTHARSQAAGKPYLGFGTFRPEFVALALYVIHRDVDSVRVEMADGRVAVKRVERSSVSFLIPHNDPLPWPSNATVRLFDVQGREIISGEQPMAAWPA